MADPVRDLNNALQGYPTGNLTPQLSWEERVEGPNHQVTHFATAKFRGVDVGRGRGVSKGVAKREAAIQALQNLKAAGIIAGYY